jgi:hypothetical protein
MPKTIVQISTDPKLTIIKKFRTANMKAGELSRKIKIARMENPSEVPVLRQDYEAIIIDMANLQSEAKSNGFEIWVNKNQITGHNYENDYKETDDDDNSDEARNLAIQINDQRRDVSLHIIAMGSEIIKLKEKIANLESQLSSEMIS